MIIKRNNNNLEVVQGTGGTISFTMTSSNFTSCYLGILRNNEIVAQSPGVISNNAVTFTISGAQTSALFRQYSINNKKVILTYGITLVNTYNNVDTVLPSPGIRASLSIFPKSKTDIIFNTPFNTTLTDIFTSRALVNIVNTKPVLLYTVNSLSDLTAVSAAISDSCIVVQERAIYTLLNDPSSNLNNWRLIARFIDNTELVSSVNGATGVVNITPTNIGAIKLSSLGQANGPASLDDTGRIPIAQLPSIIETRLATLESAINGSSNT